jgi:uncharacterized RDD family membrane protein YckC
MSQPITRAQRRAERAASAAQIIPPEGVPLTLPIAGLGVRIAAQFADVFITGAFAISILILLGMLGLTGVTGLSGLAALLFFVIRIPYYVLSELAWNGQTLGKRMMKIKVVSHNAGPLTTHALVLRNIMKEAEVFLPGTLVLTLDQNTQIASWISFSWIMMALAIPLLNAHRMRLGDMLAGTHVVHLPQPILLADLARARPDRTVSDHKGFAFLSHQLDHYGRFELQTLESFLRGQEKIDNSASQKQRRETLAAIVKRIRKKIGFADAVPPADHLAFLQAFYNAQRGHLEQRQLFGDRRSDKHYGKEDITDG